MHHELVVGDTEVAEAPEPGSGIHQEVEKDPSLRIEDLGHVVVGRVGLIHGAHQLGGYLREGGRPAEVVVDHPRRGGSVAKTQCLAETSHNRMSRPSIGHS